MNRLFQYKYKNNEFNIKITKLYYKLDFFQQEKCIILRREFSVTITFVPIRASKEKDNSFSNLIIRTTYPVCPRTKSYSIPNDISSYAHYATQPIVK